MDMISYQGKGVGRLIMDKMQEIYRDFHMQMLTADGKAIDFYKKRTALKEQDKQSQCGSILGMITKIEEITKLELTFGEELGTLCNFKFPDLRINNEERN